MEQEYERYYLYLEDNAITVPCHFTAFLDIRPFKLSILSEYEEEDSKKYELLHK